MIFRQYHHKQIVKIQHSLTPNSPLHFNDLIQMTCDKVKKIVTGVLQQLQTLFRKFRFI